MYKYESLSEKVKYMTSSQIIMAMVDGLKEPTVKIDMSCYIQIKDNVCYGCAATNAICKIIDLKELDVKQAQKYYWNSYGRRGPGSLKLIYSNAYDIIFVDAFENAIDNLRKGLITDYNSIAKRNGFAMIGSFDHDLPQLDSHFSEEELNCYIKLAEVQNKSV